MSPRGVRFLAGKVGPARPASRTDEKKGKSGSIQSAQGLTGWCTAGCCTADARTSARHANASTSRWLRPQDFIARIL